MWIVLGIIVGLIALVALGVTMWLVSRGEDRSHTQMSGDDLFTLGVVFTGAGVALFVSVGPAMLGMLALGVVFMVIGAQRKRSER